ncbi:heat shock 22 kDa protein mitochondrial [Phtheirospermum japonicum]|uniref:Heat shock 22 kDa protein mitochondrial n=1 Tax=Phtheirospermum japonicum TaxID=374723 RepID=A0A830BGR4_9LAMI|nr:heat shock 22 kDa protein mitochondrial [Phtheirospermum japonicum]
MDMPGLGEEDAKVSVEQNTLMVKGEGKKVFDDDKKTVRGYNNKFDLPENVYKTNEIKAEMKNGVLKVFVPKIKNEERTDVFDVSVE